MTVSEIKLWNVVTEFPGTVLPDGFFDDVLPVRLAEILGIIDQYSSRVGDDMYTVSIDMIIRKLSEQTDNSPVNDSTMYRYLRKAKTAGLITMESRTVKIFQEITVTKPVPGEIPMMLVKNEEGSVILPRDVLENGQRYFIENGEITMKMHALTDKGKNFLEEYEAFRANQRGEN